MSGTTSKSANMISTGSGDAEPVVAKPPVASSHSEGISGKGFSAGGFVRAALGGGQAVKPGRRPRVVDNRLFPGVDVQLGLSRMGKGMVTSEAEMSKEEAGAYTVKLLKIWGLLASVDEGVIMTVMDMVFRSCAFNGTSTAQPGRAVITVQGQTFDMMEVIQLLGENFRRWARANADNIRDSLERIVRDYDVTDPMANDAHEALVRLAWNRGMQRNLTLCFDVAEYCTALSAPERAAIASSKEAVLANSVNVPDAVLGMGRAQTADGFQSGVGKAHTHVGGAAAGSYRG